MFDVLIVSTTLVVYVLKIPTSSLPRYINAFSLIPATTCVDCQFSSAVFHRVEADDIYKGIQAVSGMGRVLATREFRGQEHVEADLNQYVGSFWLVISSGVCL